MSVRQHTDADAGAAPKRRRRISAAIIVPIVGVALSAWLLPAITRQWDDRQREQELKAALIADMASATARALVAGDANWSAQPNHGPTGRRLARTGDAWVLASLNVEARLRTYFADDVVAGWQVYVWAVDRFIGARRVSASASLGDVVSRHVRLNPEVADRAGRLLVYGKLVRGRAPRFTGDSLVEHAQVRQLESILKPEMTRHQDALSNDSNGLPRLYSWRVLEKLLLGLQQAVGNQIVTAHANGFSTTTEHLVDDLLP